MPDHITTDPERADRIVLDLLSRYLLLNTHDASGGDLAVGMQLEHSFQAQRLLVTALVSAGLRTGEVLF